ncbi:MAG TPA: erythromycin esterase family protein, partial [Polyangiaceae bacterium]
ARWLAARATPLAPLTAGGDLSPLEARAFDAIVGDAPVVAMGEATHGSSEFAGWRQRVFQTLVRDRGFTVYAVEVGYPDALALDDYVVYGLGSPIDAIQALTTTKEETEETLALVRWMRDYNDNPLHEAKLHFEGFDVYTPGAVPRILSYLGRVDPDAAVDAQAALAPFESVGCDETYPASAPALQARTRASLSALAARFDSDRARYVAKSNEDEWTRARHLVHIVEQAEVSYRDGSARDAQMAENVEWLLQRHAQGTKVLVDAHNAHISAVKSEGQYELGERLRSRWGKGYVPIGFAFGEGGFLALDARGGNRNGPLTSFVVARAPADTFDGALGLARLPAYVVDLRGAEASVAGWLDSTQRIHSVGALFDAAPEHAFSELPPGKAFDAVIYLERVTPMHPLRGAR